MQIGRPTWQLSRWICYVQRVTNLGSRLVCQRPQIFEADFDILQDPFKDILWILIFWSYSYHTVSTSFFFGVSVTVSLYDDFTTKCGNGDQCMTSWSKYVLAVNTNYWEIEMVFRCFASSGLFSTPSPLQETVIAWQNDILQPGFVASPRRRTVKERKAGAKWCVGKRAHWLGLAS